MESGSPYLPVVTEMDAAHLCCFRTNKSEVMVLKIAQGGMADGSPLSLISPGDLHTGFSHLDLGWAHSLRPHLGHVCARDQLCLTGHPLRSDFLREEECVWSPLWFRISSHAAGPLHLYQAVITCSRTTLKHSSPS